MFDLNAPIENSGTKEVTKKLLKKELVELLQAENKDINGNVETSQARCIQVGLPIGKTEHTHKCKSHIGEPKGAIQMVCERGFIGKKGCFPMKKATLNGTSKKDQLTSVTIVDRSTSVLRILRECKDFKEELTQLQCICSKFGVSVCFTPKCHPEIAGVGIECCWENQSSNSDESSTLEI